MDFGNNGRNVKLSYCFYFFQFLHVPSRVNRKDFQCLFGQSFCTTTEEVWSTYRMQQIFIVNNGVIFCNDKKFGKQLRACGRKFTLKPLFTKRLKNAMFTTPANVINKTWIRKSTSNQPYRPGCCMYFIHCIVVVLSFHFFSPLTRPVFVGPYSSSLSLMFPQPYVPLIPK